MPTVTLSNLRDFVYSSLENNTDFYTQTEVDRAINDAIIVLNLITGFLQYAGTVAASATNSVHSVPSGVLLATRVAYNGRALEKSSVSKISNAYPTWMNETTATTDMPVTYWFPIGITKFGIYPRPSTTGRNLSVTGVAEPTLLSTGTDTLTFPSEFGDAIERYASFEPQLKAGGIVGKAAMEIYKAFLSRANELKRYQSKIAPQFYIAEVKQEK